jgi:hypothetical protein
MSRRHRYMGALVGCRLGSELGYHLQTLTLQHTRGADLTALALHIPLSANVVFPDYYEHMYRFLSSDALWTSSYAEHFKRALPTAPKLSWFRKLWRNVTSDAQPALASKDSTWLAVPLGLCVANVDALTAIVGDLSESFGYSKVEHARALAYAHAAFVLGRPSPLSHSGTTHFLNLAEVVHPYDPILARALTHISGYLRKDLGVPTETLCYSYLKQIDTRDHIGLGYEPRTTLLWALFSAFDNVSDYYEALRCAYWPGGDLEVLGGLVGSLLGIHRGVYDFLPRERTSEFSVQLGLAEVLNQHDYGVC